jgi:tetratricopeptide (TPR) repeat protein
MEVIMITATELLAKGELLEERGDYTRARRMYEKAFSIQERSVGAEDAQLIPYLYSLGLIQLALENEIDAQRLLTRLFSIIVREYGDSHEDAEEIRGFLNELKPRKQVQSMAPVAETA